MPDSSQNILLITLSNIGDVMMITPVIMALKSRFPQAKLTVMTSPKGEGILSRSRFIDRLVIYDKRASLKQKWEVIQKLRERKYDAVIDLKNSAIPFMVSAKKRSPFVRLFKKKLLRDRHLEILTMTGIDFKEPLPVFDFFNSEDEQILFQKLEAKGVRRENGWIVIAPVAGSGLKTWKLSGFAEVIEKLLAERKEEILLVGGERENPIVEPLTRMNPSRVHNLAGETSLTELAVLLSHCSLLLANDSSALHLGFEIRCPVAGIFGPTREDKAGRVGPEFRMVREPMACAPCDQPRCRFERQACMEDLKADKVFQVCRELLNEKRSSLRGGGAGEAISKLGIASGLRPSQ